jgi:hypothetical protein
VKIFEDVWVERGGGTILSSTMGGKGIDSLDADARRILLEYCGVSLSGSTKPLTARASMLGVRSKKSPSISAQTPIVMIVCLLKTAIDAFDDFANS